MATGYSPKIVTDGLVLALDAANPKSYPGSGTTWYDLSGNNAHAEAVNLPTFNSDGPLSNFDFDGTDDEFQSVNISQEYRDIFTILKLESNSGLRMLFGKYDDQDDSLRFNNGSLRPAGDADINDWQYQSESDIFIDGLFDQGGVSIYNNWAFVRSYRSNESGFGTSFRYEISSDFVNSSRHFIGKVNFICCYNRKLSNSEVLKNYNALKGRYGL